MLGSAFTSNGDKGYPHPTEHINEIFNIWEGVDQLVDYFGKRVLQ